MRPLRSVCIFIIFVFLGGALIAPWLYHFLHWAATIFPNLGEIARSPFHRYVNRCLLALGLAGLWPFMRSLGIRSFRDMGLGPPTIFGPYFFRGFVLGFVSLAALVTIIVLGGGRVLEHHIGFGAVVKTMLSAAFAAVVVGTIEEILFRGVMFTSLERSLSWLPALLLSSAIYALVHFFQSPSDPATIDWRSGLIILGQMSRGFVEFQSLVPGFLNLTVAGMVLGLSFRRYGTLYFPIGLHAGWIFWLKVYGSITDQQANASAWLWGSRKMIDGWCALPVLLGLLVFVWRSSGQPAACRLKQEEPAK